MRTRTIYKSYVDFENVERLQKVYGANNEEMSKLLGGMSSRSFYKARKKGFIRAECFYAALSGLALAIITKFEADTKVLKELVSLQTVAQDSIIYNDNDD